MKLLIAFALSLVTLAAAADTGSCYTIGSPDARAYCLAKARQDSSVCYTIQNPDLRAMCMAEVRR